MDFPTDEHESYIIIPHTFTATRVYIEDNEMPRMTAATIELKISCSPLSDDETSPDEVGPRAVVGFQRLKVWLDAILHEVVLIDVNSELLESFQDVISNPLMYVPGQPDDSMLSVLLHSKISAITKNMLDIHAISLTASDTFGIERIYRNLLPDGVHLLPGIEYFDGDTLHDKPWWSRPTIDICEYQKEDDESIILFDSDPLAEIGKEYLTTGKEADIIVFDAWKKDE
jgi:hypothetical protein